MWDRRILLLAVVGTLLLFGGCSEAIDDTNTPTPSVDSPTATPTATQAPTTTTTATPTPSPDPVHPANPWNQETLSIYVIDRSELDINRTEEVDTALSFWEQNGEKYAGYPITFEYASDNIYADLNIVITDEIEQCGLDDHSENVTLGCAPVVLTHPPDDPQIDIVADLLPTDFEHVLKHELGHALGLTHDDEPQEIMDDTYGGQAIERVYRYTLDIDSSYHPGGTRNDVEFGLEFIESGANGTIRTDVTFVETDDPGEAHFEITIAGDVEACDGEVYCTDYDAHPSRVTTADMKRDYISWFVSRLVWQDVASDVGAHEMPYEFTSEDVDPTKTWWD